ncbi:MAG: hypothetical protein ABW200_00785, partial [Hyphomicrobiaceae bacterium]
MGPVNWLAVILAANLAAVLRIVWYGPIAGRTTLVGRRHRRGSRLGWLGMMLLLLVSAAMLGHMFARLGPGKPWLYFMMSGGVAAAFILPALWLAYGRRGIDAGETAFEATYWL